MKLYVRAEIVKDEREKLDDIFDEVIYDPWTSDGKRFYEDEMAKVMEEINPDVLITELDQITEKVLSHSQNLKLIVDCRSTPENIDMDAVNKHRMPLIHTPARNAEAVAEMLVGSLVTYLRQIISSNQWVRDGEWQPGTTPYYIWKDHELYSKTVGFVGFGAVARRAAALLTPFGCKMMFYDPYVDQSSGDIKKTDLETIFSQADIVSIHLPVTADTTHMINMKYLSLMKKDTLFVNTSRAAVVDNDALYKVLSAKKIEGAIIDVLNTEPPKTKEDLKLALLDNVLCTPHIYGSTHEVVLHQSEIAVDAMQHFFKKDYANAKLMNPQIMDGVENGK